MQGGEDKAEDRAEDDLRRQHLLGDEELQYHQAGEHQSEWNDPSSLPGQELVRQHERQRRGDGGRDEMGVPKKLSDHIGREPVEETPEGCGEIGCDEPANGEETKPR